MIYQQTSGTSPAVIYETETTRLFSSWGFSWGNSWGVSWGNFTIPFYQTSTKAPGDPYETTSGSEIGLYDETSGTSPNVIYEET